MNECESVDVVLDKVILLWRQYNLNTNDRDNLTLKKFHYQIIGNMEL